jgi:peroxiredoxin
MKKKIIAVLMVLAAGFTMLIAFKIYKKYHQNKSAALQKHSLPNFQLYSQNLRHFNAAGLKSSLPVCIFYYNADCEHCQYEATQINKNIDAFRKTQVIMVSTNTPEETAAFSEKYNLNSYLFITWLYDKDYSFYKWFGNSPTPSVFIYNARHKLIKEYKGEVKIESVLKYLNDGKEG